MKTTLLFIALFISVVAFGQNLESQEILAEGKLLCRLEKASWYATDHFLNKYEYKREIIGGYLSYENADHKIVTIFFNHTNNDKVEIRYIFDSIPKLEPISVDIVNTEASQLEKDLIAIRQDALSRINKNEDNFFTLYENTSFNAIPLITKKERKVFVLTGPQITNIVIIGNDYLLKYNKKNKFKKKEKLHNSMLTFPYRGETADKKLESTYHSHTLTDYITSTDICTLLLYKDFVEWTKHYVMSKNYVSLFDLEKETLLILKREAWEKIMKHQEEMWNK